MCRAPRPSALPALAPEHHRVHRSRRVTQIIGADQSDHHLGKVDLGYVAVLQAPQELGSAVHCRQTHNNAAYCAPWTGELVCLLQRAMVAVEMPHIAQASSSCCWRGTASFSTQPLHPSASTYPPRPLTLYAHGHCTVLAGHVARPDLLVCPAGVVGQGGERFQAGVCFSGSQASTPRFAPPRHRRAASAAQLGSCPQAESSRPLGCSCHRASFTHGPTLG